MKKVISILLMLISSELASSVVYNKSGEEITDRITLANIFTKKQKFWKDGTKIVVYTKPLNSIEHKFFVTEWLGMTNTKYKSLLESETYSGSSTNVNQVKSDEEMIISVATTPNSIGYVDNVVIIRGAKDVKVISTL